VPLGCDGGNAVRTFDFPPVSFLILVR
jgi:hypothetical protein